MEKDEIDDDYQEGVYPFDCKLCGRQGEICLDQYEEFWLCRKCYNKYILRKKDYASDDV